MLQKWGGCSEKFAQMISDEVIIDATGKTEWNVSFDKEPCKVCKS